MATPSYGIAEAALHLETAAAQLRALSLLPEAEHDDSIWEAIASIQDRVSKAETKFKTLRTAFRSFRDKTNSRLKSVEAQVKNDKMRQLNKQHVLGSILVEPLHDHDTNKVIPGFPVRARDFRQPSDNDCIRIASALGWNLDDGDSRYMKQNFVIALAGLSKEAVDNCH